MRSKLYFFLIFTAFASVSKGIAQLNADFSTSIIVNAACVQPQDGAQLQANDVSTGNIVQWIWSTDKPRQVSIDPSIPAAPQLMIDPYEAPIPTSFELTLVVIDSSGNADTVTKTVNSEMHFAPIPKPNYRHFVQYTEPLAMEEHSHFFQEQDIQAYEWILNNEVVSEASYFTLTISESGTYSLWLKVTDKSGCPGGIHPYEKPLVIVKE